MVLSIQDVGLAVKRLQWRHHREANKRLATVGLSLAQWDVLRHLHAQPGASLHALATLTFQTDQSMGSLATRMIDRGLLERVDAPGRAVQHRLTRSGEKARKDGARIFDGVLTDSIGQLSQTEMATLYRLLSKAND